MSEAVAVQLAAVERWYIRRGIPHFIEDYDAGTDVWTRAVPVLVPAYVLLGLNGLDLADWSLARNLAATAGSLAILAATWALATALRGQRLLGRPREVAPAELGVFVVGPSLTSVAFGQQWTDAFQSMVQALGVLAVIYVTTSYGLIPMARWAAGRLVVQLADLATLCARALPLLLFFTAVLFLTAEVWQVATTLTGSAYWLTLGLFVVTGVAFVVARIPRDLRELAHFDSWDDVRPLVAGTPAAPLPLPAGSGPGSQRLGRRQWANIGLVTLFAQALQVLIVAAAMGVFLTILGILAIRVEVISSWSGRDVTEVVSFRQYVLTQELLRVTGFLATLTGLYFVVFALTDATYRAEFREEVVSEMRQSFAVRAVYLAALRSSGEGS